MSGKLQARNTATICRHNPANYLGKALKSGSVQTQPGSELEILSALPFDQYQVGAFTIEHNFEEPKRSRIAELLSGHGYRLDRTQLVDDWYVLEAAARRGAP